MFIFLESGHYNGSYICAVGELILILVSSL